jgi:hypothetical protein
LGGLGEDVDTAEEFDISTKSKCHEKSRNVTKKKMILDTPKITYFGPARGGK